MEDGEMKPDPKGRWVPGLPRTLARCAGHHNEWVTNTGGSNPDTCKHYYSNRYLPIRMFTSAFDGTPLIQLFCPPMLHLLLGMKHSLFQYRDKIYLNFQPPDKFRLATY